jgi:methionyl-tRNA formyltransferase
LRIFFAGTPLNAARTLRQLVASGFEVVGVLTRQDALVGRKQVLTSSEVAREAETLGLTVIKANKLDDAVLKKVRQLNPDLGVVVAFGAIFKRDLLEIPVNGWLNVHYSLLPRWRGAAPVQHSILSGDRETGVSVFQLDDGMDTGPIWSVARTEIQPRETAGELLDRLTGLGISALLEAIPKATSRLSNPDPQEAGRFPLASKPDRAMARLAFTQSAQMVELKVRAMNPEPTAWSLWRGEALQVLSGFALGATDWSSLESDPQSVLEGTIQLVNGRVLVVCQSGSLFELKSVKPAGKSVMSASDWTRGFSKETDWMLH